MKFRILIFICAMALATGSVLAQSGIVQAEPSLDDRFPKRLGGLRFSQTTIRLGIVFNNEIRTDTIRMLNSTGSLITVSAGMNLPGHIRLEIQPEKLDPGKEGLLFISYDASKRQEFGFVFDRIMLKTNDPAQADKNLNITGIIKEYFPPATQGDTLISKRTRVPENTFNFGRLQQGEKSLHDFIIYNDGKQDLLIHHAKSNCGCIKTIFSKKLVPPGDSTIVGVEFDSFGKDGSITKEVSVYVNDPAQSELHFTILGEVWK